METNQETIERSTKSKVYKGLSSQTLIVVAKGVLEISVFALMSRLLTPEDFGFYAVIVAVTSVFQCLTEAGLGSAVIQRNDASKEYISTALGLSALLGTIFMLLLIVLAKPLSMLMGQGVELVKSFRLMSATLLLCSVNSVARAMFMRTLDFLKFGMCEIFGYVISSAIGIVLAIKGYGVDAIIASAIANSVLMTCILFGVKKMWPNLTIHKAYIKDIMSYGGWLTGSVIVRRITTELDKLILTRWIPIASIGAYNRPSTFISRISDQVNGVFDTVLFPILSSFKDDTSKLSSSFLKAISLVSLFSMIMGAGFCLSSELIIDIFFGPDWKWLTTIFRVLSISVLFLAYSRIGDCFFRSLGWVKSYFYIRVVVCVFTLVCIYIGCYYDILGVAIGVVISRIFDSVVKITYLAYKTSVKLTDVIKSMLASTWVTILLAAIFYLVVKNVNYGEYIGILGFCTIGLFMLTCLPKLFGAEYYDNVYLVIKAKIYSLRNTNKS
ncbi:MAG: oligosaccharide flippase family protein [Alistipes sp.]|nr:oligosaccharide flippase family protein [Alistipes sp.]